MNKPQNRYAALIERIFLSHYRKGKSEFLFLREELVSTASDLGINLPKNLGDVLYSFRYRVPLPESITRTALPGMVWIIKGAGTGRYLFKQARMSRIEPDETMLAIKVPNATPEILLANACDDEQALLAKVGKDQHGVVQTEQDLSFCQERFPNLICRPVSVHALSDNRIAMFEPFNRRAGCAGRFRCRRDLCR